MTLHREQRGCVATRSAVLEVAVTSWPQCLLCAGAAGGSWRAVFPRLLFFESVKQPGFLDRKNAERELRARSPWQGSARGIDGAARPPGNVSLLCL